MTPEEAGKRIAILMSWTVAAVVGVLFIVFCVSIGIAIWRYFVW